jgi:hypothetical protein
MGIEGETLQPAPVEARVAFQEAAARVVIVGGIEDFSIVVDRLGKGEVIRNLEPDHSDATK